MPNEPMRAIWRVILRMVDVEDGDDDDDDEVDAWRCCLESLRVADVVCVRKEEDKAVECVRREEESMVGVWKEVVEERK